jgi:transposase
MSKTRRRFSAEFKAKVALEALRGDVTIQEIASRHKIHPNQVSQWKKQATGGLGDVFAGSKRKGEDKKEREIHELHAKIGQLTVERDFLASRRRPLIQ